MVIAAMKVKDACSLEEKFDQSRQHIKKQRYYFANKDPSSQGYGFSCGHVLAWRIPGMGEPGGLPSVGSHRVGHN